MARTASKIFYYFSVVVLLILLIVVGYTQTVSFKKSLRAAAFASAEQYLNAAVYLGEIKGNLFTGFRIDTVAMYVDGALCAMIPAVDVQYDPIALWNKRIALTSVELTRPTFSLIRYRDGSWNADRIVKEKSKSDTAPSPWTILVKRLKIADASLRLFDSTASPESDLADSLARRKINFSDLDLRGINLDLSAEISAAEQYVAIRRLTCISPREQFEIRSFAVNIRHNKTATTVDDFRLKTASSSIELSAKTIGVDVFAIKDIGSLKHIPVRATLRQSTVSSSELQQFLPELYFLNGSVGVNLSVSGEFGDLAIEDLRADFGRTHLNLHGALRKLDTPKLLTLDVESRGSILHPMDAPALLPYFSIPSFPDIGDIEVNFHYTGMPLDFAVVMSARTDAGDFSVDGGMDLTGPVMKYKVNYTGRGVDVERFFRNPSLRSYINCSGSIEGRGTSLEDLATGVTLTADSSLWNNIPISHLQASVTAEQKTFAATLGIRSPRGDISFHSNLTFLGSVPAYSISGTVSNVDLAALFHDDYYSSALSFDFAAHASDTDPDRMRGSMQVDFRESRFRTVAFDSVHASLAVTTDSLNNKVVTLLSPVADFTLSGMFTYGSLVRKIGHQVTVLQAAYESQRSMFDTVKTTANTSGLRPSAADTAESMESASLRYSLRLKNLEPLALFLGARPFNAVGGIDGSIDVDRDVLSAHGTVDLKAGRYVLANGDIALENTKLDFAVNNVSGTNMLAATDGPTLTATLSSRTLFVDGAELKNLNVEYDYRQQRAAFSFRGELDTTLSAVCSGSVVFSDSEYAIRCKRLSAVFQGYDIAATSPFGVRLGALGVAVDSVTFRHEEEEITLQGTMGFHGTLFGHAALKDFSLANIAHFGRGTGFRESAQQLEGKVQAELRVVGAVESPEMRGSVSIAGLGFRGTPFGNIEGVIRYEDRAASVSIQQNQADSLYEFLIVGSIPMDLAFTKVLHRFDIDGMDLYFRSKGFQMSIIDPFIGEVDDMRGELQSAVHATGSLTSPRFSGSASLRNGEFLLGANGMRYRAEGSLEFQDTIVTMSSFVLRNLVNEFADGRMDITGQILMTGFVPHEYHLQARGELKVLQEAGRTGREGMYGDLIAATGDEGFRFEGTSVKSQVKGTILLRQADLTFPSSKQSQATLASRYVTVAVVDDTSKPSKDTLMAPLLRRKQALQLSALSQSTFLDGLGYDLTIQTQGVIKVRMMFNQATSEELFADLNGKLTLSKEQDNTRLIGTINVSERSYYTFYKKFDAAGTLTFTGKPDNPQLDIKARYSGTHVDTSASADKSTTSKVTVTLTITGTRYEPKLKLGLTLTDQNNVETERLGDVEGDAISFLLTSSPGGPGKFRDDLTSRDKQNIATTLGGPIGEALISGYANTLLSGIMLDFLRANSITFVSNAELRYVGAQPDLRLSGELYNAYWSFGGRIFNDINNANVSLQLPLGSLIGNDKMRNFMVELERKNDALDAADTRRSSVTGARVYYRIIF